MRWPDTCKLMDRIRRERPEMTVDFQASSAGSEHYLLRLCCLKRGPGGTDTILGYHLVEGSIDTIYGPDGWTRYKEKHPEPFCTPEESYHTDANGWEVDHRGRPVAGRDPPAAPKTPAHEMLERLVRLNRADPDWWKDAEKFAAMAAAWACERRPTA